MEPELNAYRVIKLAEKRWAAERWDSVEWIHVQTFARRTDATQWVANVQLAPRVSRGPVTKHPREQETD